MLSPKQLDEYLDVLRDKSVTHFSCEEFSVVLGAELAEAEEDDIATAIKQAAEQEKLPRVARGLLGHPSLWPDGPARFPGAERSTPEHKPTHEDEE